MNLNKTPVNRFFRVIDPDHFYSQYVYQAKEVTKERVVLFHKGKDFYFHPNQVMEV